MNNPVQPIPCKILSVVHETEREWTFRVETDAKPAHGQFMQLSIPKVGEAPISVSAAGEGWVEFTIRAVGKVTDVIFRKGPGDLLFLRGPYGKGWPVEEAFRGKHMVIIAGGTALSPVRSMLNQFYDQPESVKSVTLICGFKDENSILFQPVLLKCKEKFRCIYALYNAQKEGWRTGFVTSFVGEIPFDQFDGSYAVVVAGPPPMMKFTGQALLKEGVGEDKIWMSFERKMSCAIGKCGHCRIDETYGCLEGPVFPYTKAKYLVD